MKIILQFQLILNHLISIKNGFAVVLYLMEDRGLEGDPWIAFHDTQRWIHRARPLWSMVPSVSSAYEECQQKLLNSGFAGCQNQKTERKSILPVLLCHLKISLGNQTHSMKILVVQETVPW